MDLRTRLYLSVNALCGTPEKIEPGKYRRTELEFEGGTRKLLESLEHRLSPTKRVLVVGCGWGAEAAWFARKVASVTAIDVSTAAVEIAAAATTGLGNVECRIVSERPPLPFADETFDMIFMHNVCEHIIHTEACFADYHRVLKPGGVLVNSFAPLFYSPFGAHLQDALKLPWGHLIFGLKAVLALRNLYYPGVDTSRSWEEMGLNRLTERRYRRIVARQGFECERHVVLTSKGLPLVGKIPLLRNLFILEVDSILRKPATP